ncbi:MAG: bifunctional enoyl-CoA hydratase/phosphate acetyltransferase [Alphaproteobacteria bacterium]
MAASHQHLLPTIDQLIEQVKQRNARPMRTAIVHVTDHESLLGSIKAADEGIIEPIFVGPEHKLRLAAEKSAISLKGFRIITTEHSHAAAAAAVSLVRGGEADSLMKGSLHTDELMEAVLAKEGGLRTGKRMSHVFLIDMSAALHSMPRTIIITDGAINIFPNLEDKVDICQNAINLAHDLGVEKPYVAILSAVETVGSKIPSTIEAAALCKMSERGQITGAILDGPLAFDNAISAEAAALKNIRSPVSGRADIMLAPDLEAANILAKILTFMEGAKTAGLVLGAKVPIILTSRADSAENRLSSCALAAATVYARVRTDKIDSYCT